MVRVTISEQIKEQLIEDIFNHKYKPGDKMVESALAKSFNVSQTSIREALRSLIAMGFLESEPFKGITVRLLTKEDLMEVYTVRGALETLAAELAADRVSEEQIGELEDICNNMIIASEKGDVQERIRLNIKFHETLVDASGNKLIKKLYEFMQFASWSMMTGSLTKTDSIVMAKRHQKVIDAIRTRDHDAITNAMKEHVETGAKPVFDSYEEE